MTSRQLSLTQCKHSPQPRSFVRLPTISAVLKVHDPTDRIGESPGMNSTRRNIRGERSAPRKRVREKRERVLPKSVGEQHFLWLHPHIDQSRRRSTYGTDGTTSRAHSLSEISRKMPTTAFVPTATAMGVARAVTRQAEDRERESEHSRLG